MRRVLLGVASAALVLTALPATADGHEPPPTEPELNAACTARPGTQVLTPEGFEGTIPTPNPPLEETATSFVLDLAGLPVGTTASADVLMTWGIPTNDFDLNVNGEDSQNIQPIDPAEENILATGLRHCSAVDVTALNFLAPVVVDTLALDIAVKTKLPA